MIEILYQLNILAHFLHFVKEERTVFYFKFTLEANFLWGNFARKVPPLPLKSFQQNIFVPLYKTAACWEIGAQYAGHDYP